MNITLRQLRVFVAVAKSENISHAALALSLTQSTVSMALKELEGQLGLRLFDRLGKRIVMNSQGYWLLPRAQRILGQIQSIAGELGHASRPALSIGASTTIADCLFPRLSTHLFQQHPDLDLHLETDNSSGILDRLLARKIELGLVEGVCQHPQVTATPWWTDRLLIVASPLHPLAVRAAAGPLPLKALEASSWIMREAGSGTRAIFEHAFREALPGFSIQAELKHVPTIKALVATGSSMACLSEIVVRKEIERGQLAVVDVRDRKLERRFYMLQHKQGYQSEIQAHMTRWIMQQSPAIKSEA
ncbi:MAG TPA: LysR substrate-binding domain-containing protein [Mariprofundaceae bacterium]|nr:LysR substrate-binding domain-containing protein [Mariprofundaceae bacterium]